MPKEHRYRNIQISNRGYKEFHRLKTALEEIAGTSLSNDKVLRMLILVKVDWGNLLQIHELLTDMKVEKNDSERSDGSSEKD